MQHLSTPFPAAAGDQSLYLLMTGPNSDAPSSLDLEAVDLLKLVRSGLPFSVLENLVRAMEVSQKEVASAANISTTTLGRRKKSGRLTPMESDQLIRVARLFCLASELMAGNRAFATKWLTTPQEVLGDETPLGHASTEIGGREVEQLIGQLRHGVFS